GNGPDGGFLHANYRNNAVSYWVGLDAGAGHSATSDNVPEFDVQQQAAICGDRNIDNDGPSTCSALTAGGVARQVKPRDATTKCKWLNDIHGVVGNLGLVDGSAQAVNTRDLIEIMKVSDDN